ncbi:MAG: energy transducer TonB [Acidobacteria bacterium]|nr:energy transducer TonB [Acidobacteriota bacterium]
MNKKLFFFLASLGLALVIQASVFSQDQTKTAPPASEWVRVESDDGEFSVEMPGEPVYFADRDGFFFTHPISGVSELKEMQMLTAAVDGTYMSVEIYRTANPKGFIDAFLPYTGLDISKIKTDVKDFTIRRGEFDRSYEKVRKLTENVNFEVRFIASKTHYYVVTVWNRGPASAAAGRFLDSLRLGVRPAGERPVKISTFNPLRIDEIGGELTKKEAAALPDPPKYENGAPGTPFVLFVPQPGITFTAREARTKGVMRFKVTYSKEGRVSKILLVAGLPGGLNRLAFFSILRTKFLPAEENGRAVDFERVITYDYTRN